MNATNTFQDGLIMDSHPLATPNNVLTNCLNGTLITYNGNELILQNDVGNSKIETENGQYVQLKQGYIPVGLKEFGGILYIFSLNPADKRCEIGTFPSPNYNETKGKLINKYQPLRNYVNGNYETWDKTTFEDFNTKNLNFDVEHPLQIDCQKSYDGSINLIFTDNKNIPRLINTRFSLYGDNEYELVDRAGDNDTNIYFNDDFEYSTSLHKIVNGIVDIKFNGIQTGGNLKVGTYTFYFTLADSDDNESDFVGQSSVVTCHKGNLNDPFSVDGGLENENSYKQVSFTLDNIPRQFSRVYVYYSRNSSDASGNAITTYIKINRYYDVKDKEATFIISGYEQTLDIDRTTINTNYLTIDKAKAQSINQNILFYGNIAKQDHHYNDLREFSLSNNITFGFISKSLGNVDENFNITDVNTYYKDGRTISDKGGYYNTDNIYYFTGYWPGEYYRFGIVYIMSDYSLSPVFNIRGNINFENERNKYGVIQFPERLNSEFDVDLMETTPLGIQFKVKNLPEGVIGYFFVRQKRLKTILAQGVRIGSDQGFSYLPLLYYNENITSGGENLVSDIKWIFYLKYNYIADGKVEAGPAVLFTDGTENKYGSDALSFFMDYQKDNMEEVGLGIPDKFIRYNTDEKAYDADNIKLGWFTESFIHGKDNVVFNDNMRVYNLYNLWVEYGWATPYLGESFIGSEQVREFFTIGNGSTKSPMNAGEIQNIEKDTKRRKKGEPVVSSPVADALIVPEYEVKQSEFNQLFTGGELQYKKIGKYTTIHADNKIFTLSNYQKENDHFRKAYIVSVPENTPAVRAKTKIYSSLAGNAAEAHRVKVPFTNYRILTDTYKNKEINGIELKTDKHDETWAVRGIYGPYVGIEEKDQDYTDFNPYDVVNIYIPNRNELTADDVVISRRDDASEWYPICKRTNKVNEYIDCFCGDTFICNFAHTMNRNFADPSFPMNTEIADYLTWAKGADKHIDGQNKIVKFSSGSNTSPFIAYKSDLSQNTDALEMLNRSDVNAVALGHILTFKVYSSTNLCMRSTDGSNITERATFNQVRSFYPLRSTGGAVSNKIADSYVQNGAYEKSLGEQIYTLQEEVPALKTNFSNRIIYSDIAVKDSFVNNFRTFRKTAFQDYTRQYGEIVKLVNYYDGYLLCVFEHAVALITVNEKAIASQSTSGFSYITTANVLSDTPKFLSTDYGSQWPDSVIQTTTGVYGIDTVAKKIWHYGDSFEVLSDLKIQKFLKDNLQVDEQETQPNLQSLNIKSHYNKHKQDIMFTFFKVVDDDFIGWNLCYNEITKKFTTFYSWIPSYSGNVNDIYYSFNNEQSMNNNRYNYLWQHNKENNWCNWYDEQHPFEFEFIVADHPEVHKIFNNLKMIANKTQPESFHYEVVGEAYDFKKDKPNMYYRQEETKKIYSNNYPTSDLAYDKNYTKKVKPKRNAKSAMFPLTVSHVDKKNKIYDTYQRLTSKSQDYQGMSGSEIVYDNSSNEFDIATHIKAYPIDGYEWTPFAYNGDSNTQQLINYYKSHNIQIRYNSENECYEKKVEYGRRLGNCKYSEDQWEIQIPSINYAEKNENWTNKPPINIAMTPIPEDLMKKGQLQVPADVETDYWGSLKQTRLRDKYIRIRVRYTGDQLAIISAIITQYKESYN